MPPKERRRSLLVATDDYQDPGFQQLRAPAGDAKALAGVLRDPKIGDFDVEPVALNEPHREIMVRLDSFFEEARGSDFLLLYLSGHGVLDSNGKLYFAAADTVRTRLRSTAIEAGWLDSVIEHSLARQVVLLLDCCHSGAFPSGMLAKGGDEVDYGHRFGGAKVTLTASDRLEYAFEEGRPVDRGEHEPGSLFTQVLIEGLRSGEADESPMDGEIHVEELHSYVCRRIKEKTRYQTPGLKGELKGDPIFIARNPNAPATVLPAEILSALESPLVDIRVGATQELAKLRRKPDRALAEAAKRRLSELVDDDSKKVSLAAQEAIGGAPSPPARKPSTKQTRTRKPSTKQPPTRKPSTKQTPNSTRAKPARSRPRSGRHSKTGDGNGPKRVNPDAKAAAGATSNDESRGRAQVEQAADKYRRALPGEARRGALVELVRALAAQPAPAAAVKERQRAGNRKLLQEAPLEKGWYSEQQTRLVESVNGEESLVWLCRCKKSGDDFRSTAMIVTTEKLAWSRETWYSSAEALCVAWTDVESVSRKIMGGIRLTVAGSKFDFTGFKAGIDLSGNGLGLDVDDLVAVMQTLAEMARAAPARA